MEFRTSVPKTLGLVCLGIAMVAASYFAATHSSGLTMMTRLPAARQLAAKGNIALGFPALSLSFNGLDPGLDRALKYARTHVPEKTDAR